MTGCRYNSKARIENIIYIHAPKTGQLLTYAGNEAIRSRFHGLADSATGPGRQQASYLADRCEISAWHMQAIYHLQNAKH
jgi:hypothetical protein